MLRAVDVTFSLIALLILSPFLSVITLALRLTGEGEVLYIQNRIGKDGKVFGLIKFATMVKDSANIGTGTITIKDDPRILPLGGLLRKTKINELPQLLNILLGHMSVIGPRPQDQRCFNAFPESSRKLITSVSPGLSGVGSIVFRDEENILGGSTSASEFYDHTVMPYKAELEVWYVENRSMSLYFLLIFLTALAVIAPNRFSVWLWLKSLPAPPPALRPALRYPQP